MVGTPVGGGVGGIGLLVGSRVGEFEGSGGTVGPGVEVVGLVVGCVYIIQYGEM